jgi:hypothetical protein
MFSPLLLVGIAMSSQALAQHDAAKTPFLGSLAPDVYLDDITYTIRMAYMRTATISWHDPNVAYVGSWDGYVWKTVDGGQTWDESRLIVEPFPFYGDGGQRLYFGSQRTAGPSTGISSSFGADPYTTSLSELKTNGRSAEFNAEDAANSFEVSGSNANFGVGLPGSAPRLQLLVRKFGKTPSGLNLKQMLWMRGTRPTEVRIIIVHPKRPEIVFACTAFGLYRTGDGGRNWVRTFIGTSSSGRFTVHVAIDPNDENKVLLATGEGVYISHDGGNNFLKSTSKGVGEGFINWILFSPYDSRYVFVGTDSGLLRSSDGGQNWEWIYFTTFPTARVVRTVVIDPFDKKTGYIATHDGMFMTPDILHGGLESWTRLGGLQFTGIEVSRLTACPLHKGHLWALTNMKLPRTTSSGLSDTGGSFVLESLDSGESWKVIYAGNTNGSMQWFENDPKDPDLLWLLWSRSMARMRRKSGPIETERRDIYPDDPPVTEVLAAALSYTGTSPERQLEYRRRSLYKALVPNIEASFSYDRFSGFSLLQDGLYDQRLPFRKRSENAFDLKELKVLLTWDLSDIVFNLQASLFGRIDRLNNELQSTVVVEVHRFYGELRRLRILMANDPPKDLRVRLIYKMRIEELTIYLNFITGNYLTRWRQGDRPSGTETKWWEPWATDKKD